MSARTHVRCQEHPFCDGTLVEYPDAMSDPASIEHRHLRSAIEYAVVMGDEIVKRKAAIACRVSCGRCRARLASRPVRWGGCVGRSTPTTRSARRSPPVRCPSWSTRSASCGCSDPTGGKQRVERLVAELAAEADDADLRTSLRREEKRRYAAENVAVRLRADIAERDASLDVAPRRCSTRLRADVVKAEDEAADAARRAGRRAHRSPPCPRPRGGGQGQARRGARHGGRPGAIEPTIGLAAGRRPRGRRRRRSGGGRRPVRGVGGGPSSPRVGRAARFAAADRHARRHRRGPKLATRCGSRAV